jgi:hypothetical protein
MIEIEKYPCNDDNEARSRERHWYEELQATMNTRCPTLDVVKKKVNFSIYKKKYDEKNKYRILEIQKDYYYRNIEKIKD